MFLARYVRIAIVFQHILTFYTMTKREASVQARIHNIVDKAIEQIREELMAYAQQMKNTADFGTDSEKEEYLDIQPFPSCQRNY